MSTILDALKRLEDEGPRVRKPQPPSSLRGGATPRPAARKWALGLVIAILVVVGAAAWFRVNGRLNEKTLASVAPSSESLPDRVPSDPAENASASAATAPEGVGEPAPASHGVSAPKITRSIRREGSLRDRRVSRQTVLPVYSKQLQAKRPTSERPGNGTQSSIPVDSQGRTVINGTFGTVSKLPLPLPAETKQPLTAVGVYEAPPSRLRTGADDLQSTAEASLPPNAGLQPEADQEPYADLEPLARGNLQLQAISWSAVPKARLTIIDGQILREGQTVNGYTVIHIRSADIVVGKAGKQWKLEYGNR